MTQIRPDKVTFHSAMDTLLNYSKTTGSLVISGSVASGDTTNFTTTITLPRTNTVLDIYATNQNTNTKVPLWVASRMSPYEFISSETCTVSISYTSSLCTITVSVFNGTGGSITLTSQTWTITGYLYDVPFTV